MLNVTLLPLARPAAVQTTTPEPGAVSAQASGLDTKLTPAGRKQVLGALRDLAARVERDPRLLAALKAAAKAAEQTPQELPERLRDLENVVANADDAEAAAIAKALLAAMGLPTEAEGAGDGGATRVAAVDPNRPTAPDANTPRTQPAELPLAARTHVWHPDYKAAFEDFET